MNSGASSQTSETTDGECFNLPCFIKMIISLLPRELIHMIYLVSFMKFVKFIKIQKNLDH